MLALFLKIPKMWRPKGLKMTFSTTPLSFDAPAPGNPCECPHKPHTVRNLSHWATFLPLTDGSIFFQIFLVGPEYACILKQSA